jgi:poly-gamma-glutamate capsule biosynthesis protein CapA/YwtB (metallophosphatase superfamily)
MSRGCRLDVFFGGDVAIGRGIDQILGHPSDPRLYEPYVEDARDYVALAELANGPIPRPVEDAYPFGDALAILAREQVHARIVNLETSITTSPTHWLDKGIHYRMHPSNVGCVLRLGVDVCVLANNHVLDWGYAGLSETLTTLEAAGSKYAGAGHDARGARTPAVVPVGAGTRLLIFAYGLESSGIPREWAATSDRPGVRLLSGLGDDAVDEVTSDFASWRRPGDISVASLHWGRNWGFEIPPAHRRFAHRLVERAGVDVVHGHSSHHPLGIEVHRGRLVLYGAGDLLNDYEGIRGHEAFRGELSLMYIAAIDRRTGELVDLRMIPMRIRRLRLERAGDADARFLMEMLTREGRSLGTRVELDPEGRLRLRFRAGGR